MNALGALWAAVLAVTGSTTCPGPADVARALESLLPPAPAEARSAGARAELLDAGTAVVLRWLGPDGAVLAEKKLPVEGSCAAMAETAAVVLAAWEAQLQTDVSLAFEAPAPVAHVEGPAPPASPARHWSLGIGASVLASYQSPTFAPAAAIELRLRRIDRGWSGKLGFGATGAHTQTFEPGRAVWRRVSASVGLARRASWKRGPWLDAGLDVVAALLWLEGDGFTTVRSQRAWDFGATGAARFGLALGRVEPWLTAGGTAWLRPQLVEVTGLTQQGQLDRLELVAGAGLTVFFSN